MYTMRSGLSFPKGDVNVSIWHTSESSRDKCRWIYNMQI
jgi:hypothetical protein